MIWIGIDVGKSDHHACAIDATGKAVFTRKLVNGQAEIEAVVARAHQAAEQVRRAVDMTSGGAGLVLAVLATAGQQVIYVPGRLVNRMAGAYAGEGKTDAKDATPSPRPPAPDRWDEVSIRARTAALTQCVVKVWVRPVGPSLAVNRPRNSFKG